MKSVSLKSVLFAVLFGMLFLPFLQEQFIVFKFKPLTGEFYPTEKQELNLASWFSGDYQKAFDKYTEEHIGFRNPLIRIYNQVDFSLFHVAHGGDIVVGKKGYLFQTQYLTAHAGVDFIGEAEIEGRMERLTTVIGKLREKGVATIIAFAPSKADFFSEYVPDYYSRRDSARTNYDFYRQKLLSRGLPFIDFNNYFRELKDTSTYPLFPRQGIHWSQYGMYLAVDSLLKFIRKETGLDLNELYCDGIELSGALRSTDYDLGDLCNVMITMSHADMPYPVLRFESNPAKTRPHVLIIGDSFNWNIYNSGVPAHIFHQAHFWYYNHDEYADSIPEKGVVDLANYKDHILSQDVILILQTESNLNNIGLGFFEAAYDALVGSPDLNPVLKYEEAIRNDPIWLESVRKKAQERNISLDQMIREDAEWMVEQDRAHNK